MATLDPCVLAILHCGESRHTFSSLSSKATVRLANIIHSGKHYNHIRRRLGGLAVPPKEHLGAVFHEVEFGITPRLRKEFVF
jgi:hypothetical protein